MQNVLSTHEFEGRIRSLHNHLYANANIRTTEGIAGELAKVLMALNFHASRRQPPLMTVADVKTVLEGSADVLETLADETRGLFELANIEFIQFWVLDPFNQDAENVDTLAIHNGGDLYFHLGNAF